MGIGSGPLENVVTSRNPNPLAEDLDHVLAHTKNLWDDLRGQRVFMTGGTGFVGCWLLESLLWANDQLRLDVSVVVLARHPTAFRKKAPHLSEHPAVRLCPGDVRTFEFPNGQFSYVIHAATDASATISADDPLSMFDTIVTGTSRALEFARNRGARRFLLTSSGAVYGRQPPDITHVTEEYLGGPDPTNVRAVYAEGKRAAEMLCAAHYQQYGLESCIARCFAFVGPYLPLDIHFAVGNFIRDGMAGKPIRITGDGSPYRSYLYAADLAIWLWTILLRGRPLRPYNVGSAVALTIDELAHVVADTFAPAVAIEKSRIPAPGVPAERYVPSVERAETELGLRSTVALVDAIRRTVAWHAAGARLAGSASR